MQPKSMLFEGTVSIPRSPNSNFPSWKPEGTKTSSIPDGNKYVETGVAWEYAQCHVSQNMPNVIIYAKCDCEYACDGHLVQQMVTGWPSQPLQLHPKIIYHICMYVSLDRYIVTMERFIVTCEKDYIVVVAM